MDDMDVERLSKFSPFNEMKSDNLSNVVTNVQLFQASRGETLFKKGDSDKRSIYLLSGTIELREADSANRIVTGGTNEASLPLSPMLPRQQTAVVLEDVRGFTIDSELLDMTLTLDQTGVYEVADLRPGLVSGEDDWMTALLKTTLFEQIPPQCIQMLFMRLKRADYKAGAVVIKQGDAGDYFYVVRTGRCMVTREAPTGKGHIDLADLGVGGTFGEEALISQAKRNASVKMLTDGILMRLGRDDFQALVNEPLLVLLDHNEADEAAAQGAKWLDVRLPSEFAANGKNGAINLPLYLLRHKLAVLDRDTPYIVYCDTGRRSSAAAFILNKHGFEAAVLKEGLQSSSGTGLPTAACKQKALLNQ
ncbi:MAG: cyclic nucleotide-binding domain-containing protein [Woeseiaceae bacterium]